MKVCWTEGRDAPAQACRQAQSLRCILCIQVNCTSTDGGGAREGQAKGNATSFTFGGNKPLSVNKTYSCLAAARNVYGLGPYSDPSQPAL